MTVNTQIEKLKEIRKNYKESINLLMDSNRNFLRSIDIKELQAVGLLVDLMVQRGFTLKNKEYATCFTVCYSRTSEKVSDKIYFLCRYARLEKDGKEYTIGGGTWQIFEGIAVTRHREGGRYSEPAGTFAFNLDDLEESAEMFLNQLERWGW